MTVAGTARVVILLLSLRALVGAAHAVGADGLAPGQVFADCAPCPEMVVIAPGRFLMGDDDGKPSVRPRHGVVIGYRFAMSRREITFDEWRACHAAGACARMPDDHGWGQADRPVINVSWDDAQGYADYLTRLGGHAYRLPSEAEWEYAARAGSSTRYWWGDEIGENRANCRRCGSRWDGNKTAPTGSFAANPFGLFDMNGNVWEWTADCWAPNHHGAPIDGAPRGGASCAARAARGGSWYYFPKVSGATSRFAHPSDRGSYNVGIRVVRELN